MSKIPGEPDNLSGKFFNLKDLKKYQGRKVKLRVLIPANEFITGHVKFTAEKKPLRIRDMESFPEGTKWGQGLDGKPQQSRRFWATVVYNYTAGAEQVWEFTQATIYSQLDAMLDDEDWGELTAYDIKVSSTGEGKEVEYAVLPLGKSELSPGIRASWEKLRETWTGLDALYSGADPFAPFGEGNKVAIPYDDPDDPGYEPTDKDIPL